MVVISGPALERLLEALAGLKAANYPVYKISVDDRSPDGIAYKVNEFVWTPTLSTEER